MAVPKLEVAVVRTPRGRTRHALAHSGLAECGRESRRGWILVSRDPARVKCKGCRAAMPVFR